MGVCLFNFGLHFRTRSKPKFIIKVITNLHVAISQVFVVLVIDRFLAVGEERLTKAVAAELFAELALAGLVALSKLLAPDNLALLVHNECGRGPERHEVRGGAESFLDRLAVVPRERPC